MYQLKPIIAELLEELIKSITIGECLLLHQSGFAIPCRNGKPIGAIDEYGDICVCCGSYTPEGKQICLSCEQKGA